MYEVRGQGKRNWGIYRKSNGALVEGGFFSRTNAVVACERWNDEYVEGLGADDDCMLAAYENRYFADTGR